MWIFHQKTKKKSIQPVPRRKQYTHNVMGLSAKFWGSIKNFKRKIGIFVWMV